MVSQSLKFSGYLEPEEVRAVVDAVPRVSKYPERDQLLLELLWQSGVRVTEGITLTVGRIGITSIVFQNLKQQESLKGDDGKVVRNGKGKPIKVKKPDATKEVEVSGSLCQILKDFCHRQKLGESDYVFRTNKGHLSRWYVWMITGKASELANVYRFGKKNIRTGGRFKGAFPHIFRHSNAMHLLDQFGDISIVKEQLGHASISTTQIYAHPTKQKIQKVISQVEW